VTGDINLRKVRRESYEVVGTSILPSAVVSLYSTVGKDMWHVLDENSIPSAPLVCQGRSVGGAGGCSAPPGGWGSTGTKDGP